MSNPNSIPKTIDGLMRYLRDKKGMNIKGTRHKRKLRNMGYYHGYKGYRYITHPQNRINYSDFNEVIAINEYDMRIKALIYPQIMFIETALKNYALEIILSETKSDSFNQAYSKTLNNYKCFTIGSDDHTNHIKKRLDLRNKIYSALTREFSQKRRLVQHFYHKDLNVPIWAIFEVISLGEFGHIVSCMNSGVRKKLSLNLGLHQACDSDGLLTQKIVYTLKDLRNAVAHNEIIFDVRFVSGSIGGPVKKCLELSTHVNNITFDSIVDYIVLITYLLKNFAISKYELNRFINEFEGHIEALRKQIPINLYSQIIPTTTSNKLNTLKNYVKL